jgi:hypothetical protein
MKSLKLPFLSGIAFISWSQTGIITLTLFLIGAGLLAQTALQTPVSTSSKATILHPTPTPITPATYPNQAPVIDRLEPWFGKPGDTVRLRGSAFGQEPWNSQIFLNGITLNVKAWSDSAIDIILPHTNSGLLTFSRGDGTAVSLSLNISSGPNDPIIDFQNDNLFLNHLTVPAILTLNYHHKISLTPKASQVIPTTIKPHELIHASLQSLSGTYLPLSLPPESLLDP